MESEHSEIPGEKVSLFKEAQKPGLILAAIGIAFALIVFLIGMEDKDWLNYLMIPVIIAVLITYGKKLREDKLNKVMSFGQGFKFSFFAIFISTIITSIFNYFYFAFISPTFIDSKFEKALLDMEEGGSSAGEIEQAIPFMEPWFNAPAFTIIAFVSGIVFGLVLALIIGAILKKQ